MTESLNQFLIENIENYTRMTNRYEVLERVFWTRLGIALKEITAELLPERSGNLFGNEEMWDALGAWCVHLESWVMKSPEGEFVSPVALWFPIYGNDQYGDLFHLLGLSHEGDPIRMEINLSPLSERLGDVGEAKRLWADGPQSEFMELGWVSFGNQVKTPKGNWGMAKEICLDSTLLAQHIDGDLRAALGPLEDGLYQFAELCPKITRVVEAVRDQV